MKIAIVNGPNINMIGIRPQNHYGTMTYEQLNDYIKATFPNVEFEIFQSNHEGELIDYLQQLVNQQLDGIIINAGGLTHTSISLADTLEILTCLKVEVHLSEVDAREEYRQVNYIRSKCHFHQSGLQQNSYIEAIKWIICKKNENLMK